jgi:hypothetical protein
MSNAARTYRVLILPKRTVAATGLSLSEAAAWIQGYNAIFEGLPSRAVVDEETPNASAAGLVSKTPPLRRFMERQQVGARRAA